MKVKTTKTVLLSIIAFLTFLLFFQACEKGKNIRFIGAHSLQKNEIVRTSDNGKKIVMEVLEIQDTRCPINADCIGMGSLKIKIKFTDEHQDQTFELCEGSCYITNMPVKKIISLNGSDYELVLQDITPFPNRDTTKKEIQKAIVIISRATK